MPSLASATCEGPNSAIQREPIGMPGDTIGGEQQRRRIPLPFPNLQKQRIGFDRFVQRLIERPRSRNPAGKENRSER